MRSKTSSFNSTLFWKTVVRFWPIWFAYSFVWAVMMPMSVGNSLASTILYSGDTSGIIYALQRLPLEMGSIGGTIVAAIFGCFAAMGSFSHLYSARSTGAFASLPLRREGVFSSVTLAGILPMLIINVVIFAVTLIVEAVYATVYMPALLQWLALTSMLDLFFFGFAVLCAQLTGSLIVLPLVYAVLNFTEFIVEYLVRHILGIFVYGYAGTGFSLDFLSPIIGVFNRSRILSTVVYNSALERYFTTGYYFTGWGWIIGYAVAGLVLITGSLMLYKRRRMETAGDVVAVRCLKPVFKYCLALGCGLCIGVLLFTTICTGYSYAGTPDYVLALLGFMFIGCFIGYFAAEMLIWKSFAVWRGRWPGLLVTLAVVAALTFSFEFDLFGYEKKVPSADDVKSVTMSVGGDSTVLVDPQNISATLDLHESIVADKAYHETGGGYNCYMYLLYSLDDGTEIKRSYTLVYNLDDDTGDVRSLQNLINTQEAIDYRKHLNYDITANNIDYASISYRTPNETEDGYEYQSLAITDEEANELYYTCILPDINDGALGRIWLISDENYLNTVYACSINIECNERDSEGEYTYQNFYTVPTVDSTRTNAWLEAHGVELHTEGAVRDADDLYPSDYAVRKY